ncbi:MAG: response regulator [Parasulfuritortus sp.]|jgi:CheY-like chemotaxis protein|nr:response regulator [Parasulfuritortus sp.]
MSKPVTKARILVVDDEPVNLALVAGILADDYLLLDGATSGTEGLARARAEQPDLVLTDIAMPDLTGYDLCRALKEDHETAAIPVIFLSGAVGLDEHLAGHDAGGEDFLAKPFKPAELLYKVANALRLAGEKHRLASDANQAFHTAMVAMSSAAELGVVLNFVRNSFACSSYVELADLIVSTCSEFGLNACVRLCGRNDPVSRNRSGVSSSLEAGILEHMAGFGRIVDFSQRTAINYDTVTLMIMDMPRDDAERYGRLRDHLATLCECADARVRSMDDALDVDAKRRMLADLVDNTRTALTDIDQRHRHNQNNARVIMHGMLATIEQSFSRLDLTDEQEDYIADVMRAAVQRVMDLFAQGLAIDDHLRTVSSLLGDSLKINRASPLNPSPSVPP